MPLPVHTDRDPLATAHHGLTVAVSALAVVNVDKIPAGYARRLAALRTEAAVLAHELGGPQVIYRKGDVIVHGNYIADYSTDTTVAIRVSDGHILEVSAEGKFSLFPRAASRLAAAA